MMRWIGVAMLCTGLGSGAVLAEENFIPKGHTYSPDNLQLPPLNSREDQINGRTDIYESEIYTEQKQRKLLISQGFLTPGIWPISSTPIELQGRLR